MRQLTDFEQQKLQKFAATTILSNVKDKLKRMSISADDQEIMSEIWNQYAYLVQNYKEGTLSLTSYCFQYAEPRTIEAFRKERDQCKMHVELVDNKFISHSNPVKELIRKEQSMNSIELENEVILNPKLVAVLKSMRGDDLQMAKMYVSGITLEKIGNYFGISAMAVLKRLRKYGE